jgi:glutamyl-tRNA reductase
MGYRRFDMPKTPEEIEAFFEELKHRKIVRATKTAKVKASRIKKQQHNPQPGNLKRLQDALRKEERKREHLSDFFKSLDEPTED